MPYYLIKQWTPHRGQTRDNPGCYFGPGFHGHNLPESIRSIDCYSSLKRAERVSAKRYSVYSPNEIVELDPRTVRKFIIDPVCRSYVPQDGQSDRVTVTLNDTTSRWTRIDAIRFYTDMELDARRNDDTALAIRIDYIIQDLCSGRSDCTDAKKL